MNNKKMVIVLGLAGSVAFAAAPTGSSGSAPAGNTTATGSQGMGNSDRVGTSGAIQNKRGSTSSTTVTTESTGILGSPNTAAGAGISTNENSPSGNPETRVKGRKADNTKMNERDRAAGAVTADQQSMDSNDMGLTRRIRENLSAQDKLSTYGKNVKIITNSGKVVLRGPVRSAEEKRMIEESATSVAGAGNVTNQLEIVTK